ncbi:aldehyde dehydrogenase family protein [Sporosarcina psychrophila]|uniref:aldehyde dehydrogenase family protein n=1 Tax=Sporosarcina psychrophila TaxID=1476 RepID=UPI0030CF774B
MITANELKKYHNLINGDQTPASTGDMLDNIDPSTAKVWAKIPRSTIEDVETVVASARKAFPSWAELPSIERAEYMRRIGDLLAEHGEELSALETRGNGWVIRETSYGLIPALKQIWYDAAGAASEGSEGETIQMGKSSFGCTLREPLGVVLGITPWNAPLFTFTIKAAYALVAGNTVIIKPSEHAAASSLRYGELLAEILPPGVLSVISGLGSEIGDALVSHPEINKVSLTGSGTTAKAIAQTIAGNPKPLIFELGGKSPNIVFADADLDKAADGITGSIFTGNAGQLCVGGSRILIQRSIFAEMITRIKGKMLNPEITRLGDPMKPESTMGPIANLAQYEKVCSYIDLGVEEGAEIVFGGRHGGEVVFSDQPQLSDGYWVEPTLFKVNSNSLRICQEEIFGPVATVMPFDTVEEAVAIANDTSFGLGAGVWTNDLSRAHQMIRRIAAGNVWVNTYGRVGPGLPFGGFKESGYGTDSILEYTHKKACVIELG